MEEEVLRGWREGSIFERSVSEKPEDRCFSFYDGPPFATGLPHYGHLLAGTIKDVVPRYWTMRGYRVERRFGWDCHGLPVEFEMEKKLELQGRKDIEAFGVAKFNEACRSIVLRYTGEWRKVVERMGRWVDFTDEYKTMDLPFMESVWGVFRKLWDQGLIYEGFRVVPYSWRVGAPLSNFEANLNYREVQDPSITVRFRLDNGMTALAWTTTPWTLPSNLALTVHPDADYAVVDVDTESGTERIVIHAERVEAHWPGGEGVTRVSTLKGSELIGTGYEPLFPFFSERKAEGAFHIIAGDFVTAETGTGIVHTAPAFGEDDHAVCKVAGIELVDPVDAEGRFTQDVTPWAGERVKDADKGIIAELKSRGRIFLHETYVHSYPFCYRSDTPLIYKSIPAWYVAVEKIKDRLVAHNQKVQWVPSHLRDGRFGKWLENARDWNISRNRYWGNPLPIWRNEETGETICIGSRAELEELSGRKVDDLHKHIVDEITIPSPTGRGVLRRIPEVLDCWFESGSMPYGQAHYPFENKEAFEAGFPADFIAEGIDQTRGWFYTLMVLSTALFDKPAFKNVIVNGLVLAEDGRKMSKRLQNYPNPMDLIGRIGADAVRIYMLQSPAVRGEELRFSESGVRDMVRRVLLPWWNSVSFLVTYAHVDGWDAEKAASTETTHELDIWIGAKLERLKEQVKVEMEAYELSRVVPPLLGFIDDLTNWYIRRSRRRFWKAEDDVDKEQAYATLYTVLLQFAELMAPFTPFLSDHVYQMLRVTKETQACDSVHLREFAPCRALSAEEVAVEGRMDLARTISELGRELRASSRIRNRQPLATIRVGTTDATERAWLEASREIILDELNVRALEVVDDPTQLATVNIKPNLPRLGPRLGREMKTLAPALKSLDAETARILAFGGTATIAGFELGPDDVLVQMESADSGFLVAARGSLVVSIDPTLDDSLLAEGMAREVINRVQKMRKELDLPVEARIATVLATEGDALRHAIQEHQGLIEAETLSSVVGALEGEPAMDLEHDIDGVALRVALRRVG